MMMDGEKRPSRRWVSMLIAIGTVAVLTTSAFASRSAVQDRTLDLKQAQAYAARVSSTVLPAAVDERVLEKLNALVGTPDGREHMKASLKRMPEFQPAFEAKLAEYGLPRELLAIPLIESGYKNLGPGSAERSDAPGPRGAGIWMFIPPTARKYGLRVDDQVDERLDPAKETEAAMKYLKQLHTEFGDWALAIAAYNMGEKAVRAVIDETGSRDAWQLSRDGKLNDYLATIMAGLIVLRNPEMVE
jgi:membrane-bound lytic murein transglycosylase MltF